MYSRYITYENECTYKTSFKTLCIIFTPLNYCFTVRLVDGPTKYEGTVEVYHNGKWNTVCDNEWDLNGAQVVCKRLGFGNAVAATYSEINGQNGDSIWFGSLDCIGTEWTIGNCSQGRLGDFFCYLGHPKVKCTSGMYLRM